MGWWVPGGCCWLDLDGWWELVGCCWLDLDGWWELVGCCWLDRVGWWELVGCWASGGCGNRSAAITSERLAFLAPGSGVGTATSGSLSFLRRLLRSGCGIELVQGNLVEELGG